MKVLVSNYAKGYLKQVFANATQLNAEERTKLIRLLVDFKDLFDDTLLDWDTEPVDIELNPNSKPFHFKYYPLPRINKEAFCKEQ